MALVCAGPVDGVVSSFLAVLSIPVGSFAGRWPATFFRATSQEGDIKLSWCQALSVVTAKGESCSGGSSINSSFSSVGFRVSDSVRFLIVVLVCKTPRAAAVVLSRSTIELSPQSAVRGRPEDDSRFHRTAAGTASAFRFAPSPARRSFGLVTVKFAGGTNFRSRHLQLHFFRCNLR